VTEVKSLVYRCRDAVAFSREEYRGRNGTSDIALLNLLNVVVDDSFVTHAH
jgi:hypothetical protein